MMLETGTMAVQVSPLAADEQLSFLPSDVPGEETLARWHLPRDGGFGTWRLECAGRALHARGDRVRFSEGLQLLDQAKSLERPSDTVRCYAEAVWLADALIARGRVRPSFSLRDGDVVVGWRAVLDEEVRRFLVTLLERWPAATAARPAGTAERSRWILGRRFLDAVIDQRLRSGVQEARHAIERMLTGPERVLPGFLHQRGGRELLEWEERMRRRETPTSRLVLRLDPPTDDHGDFRVLYLLRAEDSGTEVPLSAIWSGQPQAGLLHDDLEELRKSAREKLTRAGRLLAPVEVSLALAAPGETRLTREEVWQLLSLDAASLQRIDAVVEVPPDLQCLEERFPRARVRLKPASPQHSIALAPRYVASWEVATGDDPLTAHDLLQLAQQAPLGRRNGQWLPITVEAAERLARIAQRPAAEWTGPQALAAALAGEVRHAGDVADAQVVANTELRALLDELHRERGEVPPPSGLRATLRDYQQRGVAWLLHRTRLGLGALLADDMGLGKTVQLIALLLHLKEHEPAGGPTLLVCPASLVGNWEREIARFGPSLRVVRHHGGERHRDPARLRDELGDHDVLLTTYALARRDAGVFAQVPFGSLVCDEAQNLKNAGSAQARALRSIEARRRLALTGTPVENRLSDLWSLMELLNPGLLGTQERFRREIALPLERDRDSRAARWLKAATAPFLLRRLKSDPEIAAELPEKEIIRVWCSLTEEQARLYQAAVEVSLEDVARSEGMERRGRVLRLLSDLKQICNHPAQHLKEEAPLGGRSGKFERAAEMLEEIAESGERALVFTQYVEMGKRLCEYVGPRLGGRIGFFHGALSLEQRESLVSRFQHDDDGPVALVMSLRAGGVGLNLTRATHVIHYDRWWNPAVEDQATDRAYRIGQTRRVQVHNLISAGTLEERIDRMLEDKRALAEAAIGGGEAWLTELSTDELRALVALGGDAAVESLDGWEPGS